MTVSHTTRKKEAMTKKETQTASELKWERESSIRFALDRLIIVELGSSWNVELHELRLEELMEVVNGETMSQMSQMHFLHTTRNEKIREMFTSGETVGA